MPVSVTPELLESRIVKEKYIVDGLLTLCILTLRNGFKVVGKSACVDPNKFNAETGRGIARNNAFEQMWALEGYVLANHLHT